ncbi:hypothetical protein RB653_004705 [Dictyostelium firmibasis]|uniref:Uncharacterized protein n=1 Tax=Dictyostelium firmibasis TaxID=79012 RepID=A0AAN7Z3J4_9MYCE
MTHALPKVIKSQLVQDIGVALVLGAAAGCLFKYGVDKKKQRERVAFYEKYDKEDFDDDDDCEDYKDDCDKDENGGDNGENGDNDVIGHSKTIGNSTNMLPVIYHLITDVEIIFLLINK